MSSLLGDKPISSASRYSRPSKKYVDIPQPHVVKIYNHHMGGVDCFDQNHLRIKVGGKKWYWSAFTWLLDAAIQNSRQLRRKAGSKITLLEHKREYVCTVLRQGAADRSNKCTSGRLARVSDIFIHYDNIGQYIIVRQEDRLRCAFEECKTCCQTRCEKCDRALCVYCFKKYHINQ